MRVIYVIEDMHIYNNDHKRFQLKIFEDKNILVEMWSMVRWTFLNCDEPNDIFKSKNIFYIDNIRALYENFERIKSDKCIFLCYPYHSYSYISFSIRKMIKRYGYEYCNISGSPSVGIQRLLVSKNLFTLIVLQLLRIIKLLKDSIIKRNCTIAYNAFLGTIGPYLYPSKYNFITVRLANAGFPNWAELADKNKNILVHSEAYDEYLEVKNNPNVFNRIKIQYRIPERFIVFVDDFEVGHSDFKKLGEKLPVSDRQSYLALLDSFFSVLESKFNMPVVIAEHPKAEYNERELKGRISIKGNTNHLIYNSSFVIIGASTCIGMMVLCKKSYIGYYSSEFFINVPRMKKSYDFVQSILESKYLDLNNTFEIENVDLYINKYNKRVYDNYLNKYVIEKDGIKGQFFYETVLKKMIT